MDTYKEIGIITWNTQKESELGGDKQGYSELIKSNLAVDRTQKDYVL